MNINVSLVLLIGFSLVFLFVTIGHAEGGGDMIPAGKPFVDFELDAHDGTRVSSANLAGHPFLLFFYPKASTPG